MEKPRRNVVREHLFEEALAEIIRDEEAADEFVAAAEYLLAADPLIGEPVGKGVWTLPMSPIRGADVWLYYTFDPETVYLLAIARFDRA